MKELTGIQIAVGVVGAIYLGWLGWYFLLTMFGVVSAIVHLVFN